MVRSSALLLLWCSPRVVSLPLFTPTLMTRCGLMGARVFFFPPVRCRAPMWACERRAVNLCRYRAVARSSAERRVRLYGILDRAASHPVDAMRSFVHMLHDAHPTEFGFVQPNGVYRPRRSAARTNDTAWEAAPDPSDGQEESPGDFAAGAFLALACNVLRPNAASHPADTVATLLTILDAMKPIIHRMWAECLTRMLTNRRVGQVPLHPTGILRTLSQEGRYHIGVRRRRSGRYVIRKDIMSPLPQPGTSFFEARTLACPGACTADINVWTSTYPPSAS